MASGKGGTGKTTIAVNLALHLSKSHHVALFDLDVEEPNCNHFLHCELIQYQEVNIPRPIIDEFICSHCGLCADLCEFNALAVLFNQVMVFEELCHGCGLCTMACPEEAIKEKSHQLGVIRRSEGSKNNLVFYEGKLNVGEALATPIIRELKKIAFNEKSEFIILDLPPGSDCPVIEGLSKTDFTILVTEPTPAGEHDLRIAINLVKQLEISFGIVNNRSDVGDDRINHLVKEKAYELLLEIPHDKEILQLYSNGLPLIGTIARFDTVYSNLWFRIQEVIH
ncbi:MAG: ATP-binding protein [Candidatus Heimdallarchaeota archaeon]|nr:MAG: ATP-binding protein [Candidatus Heimdallarchaeota archaeon]